MIDQQSARPGLRLLSGSSDRDRPGVRVLDAWARQRGGRGAASIGVLVAGAQDRVRAGYRALLQGEDGIAVLGEAATAGEAIRLAVETRPDVVLLDLAMRGLEDVERTADTVSHPAFAAVAVTVIAPSAGDERVLGALGAGAVGVLGEDTEADELIRGVYLLARGEALIRADALRRLARESAPRLLHQSSRVQQLKELTARERVVLALVARGLSNVRIAEELVISPATAKTHVCRAMAKLGARNRAQLVVLTYETGLVRPRSGLHSEATQWQRPDERPGGPKAVVSCEHDPRREVQG
jgi:DNA-binding NarL/FixJ family response regulator